MRRSTKTDPLRAGFTLVEVLVASAVAVVLAVAVAGVLHAGFSAWSRVAARPDAEAALARLDAFEALRADVASALPLRDAPFRGDARGFSSARLLAPALPDEPARPVLVRWAPASGGAVRELRDPGADLPFSSRPFAGSLRLSYARLLRPATSNAPAELAWSDEWTRDALPAAVRAEWGSLRADIAVACAAPDPDAAAEAAGEGAP